MSRIVVICVEGRIADLRLPFAEHRLEEIRDRLGERITFDEERKMLEWASKVNAGEAPLDEDRLRYLMTNKNDRTKVNEDQVLAKWILETWGIIKDIK